MQSRVTLGPGKFHVVVLVDYPHPYGVFQGYLNRSTPNKASVTQGTRNDCQFQARKQALLSCYFPRPPLMDSSLAHFASSAFFPRN